MPNSPRAEIPAIIIVMAHRPHKIHKRPVKNLSELKDPLKQSIKLTRRRALGLGFLTKWFRETFRETDAKQAKNFAK
jgi:hypothetical protein